MSLVKHPYFICRKIFRRPFVSVPDLPFSWSLFWGAAGYVYRSVVLNIGRCIVYLKIFSYSLSLLFLICLCLDSSNRLFPSTNSWWREPIGFGFSSSTVSSSIDPSLFYDPFYLGMLSYGSGLPGDFLAHSSF